jgi:hypothetical protein
VVPENLWEVVSLLATCRKGSKVEMREEREDRERLGCVSFFPFFLDSFVQNEIARKP